MEIQESLSHMKEELKKEIIDEILDILRDELEENFSEEFVHKVEEAESSAQKGNVSKYTLEEFKRGEESHSYLLPDKDAADELDAIRVAAFKEKNNLLKEKKR